ncbi:MAG: UvrD-helicase domain-containing protein [Pseudomonadota bacterium]
MSDVTDKAQRQAAIAPDRSFIVQAPAGSGKTALLTQRVLRLLAIVDAPEEVLAITFTRKAAGEMRERIIESLLRATEDTPPQADYERQTWALARDVLTRDDQLGWALLRHPSRLRVQTMDSFNAALTRQMPLLSGLGAPPSIADDARELHREAAHQTMTLLESGEKWSEAVATFLLHLDNRVDLAAGLLADMLARRDQWLPRLMDEGAANRAALEVAIATEVELALKELQAVLPEPLHQEIIAIASGAAERLRAEGSDSPILNCADLTSLPGTMPRDVETWQALAELLLTREDSWRKSITKNQGFPAGKKFKPEKERIHSLIGELAQVEGVVGSLSRVRILPPAVYTDQQWQLLQVFQQLLPLAAAQLQLVFSRRGEVDHTEIALRAVAALGDEENPTDLALALDYRIRHILVDEFQDTSSSQFRLLEALTRGWEPDDGRTLFLVGDPMQSIYRFREAEVGLFLRARQEGIGQLSLEALNLEVNFRSRRPAVEWVNQGFPALLAEKEDAGAGAVPFSPATAFDDSSEGGVKVHPSLGEQADAQADARKIVELAQQRLAETDDGQVAILVRTRPRAAAILPALREAGVRYQAVEIETLATRPVVQDLLALTRALVHEGDRTAWLTLLRAPWCGLTLADLHTLATYDQPLPESIANPDDVAGLSDDAQKRVARIAEAIREARRHSRRGTLRHRVQTTWLALGGPAAAGDAAALEDARAFFDLLEGSEQAADLDDINLLNEALDSLYARVDPEADGRLQVMTIHKSKGLEFDTVILPGLHAGTGRSDDPLLLWMERPRIDREPDLLMAPVRPYGVKDKEPLYQFIKTLAEEKEDHELGRLLYVAVTRAVRCLDLFGFVKVSANKDGELEMGTPGKGSLLARLWPLLEMDFQQAFHQNQPGAETGIQDVPVKERPIRRFPVEWQIPLAEKDVVWQGGVVEQDEEEPLEFSWASQTARIVGTVVHRFLQQIAEDGLDAWSDEQVEWCRPALRAMLAGLGISTDELKEAELRCAHALKASLNDGNGRWILSAHSEAQNELPLTSWSDDGPQTHIIDRTFVDEDGTRWVVDYKTGYREGGDIEGFLDQEAERYLPQLQRYADLFRQIDDRLVRQALYFPLLGRLREVVIE